MGLLASSGHLENDFPILGMKGWGYPYAILRAHEAQANRNHSQTLRRLKERGGLAPSEMLAILQGRGWEKMSEQDAYDMLQRIKNDVIEQITVRWNSVNSRRCMLLDAEETRELDAVESAELNILQNLADIRVDYFHAVDSAYKQLLSKAEENADHHCGTAGDAGGSGRTGSQDCPAGGEAEPGDAAGTGL